MNGDWRFVLTLVSALGLSVASLPAVEERFLEVADQRGPHVGRARALLKPWSCSGRTISW
jgi:hypothetical protein